jgi:hypothetical protein
VRRAFERERRRRERDPEGVRAARREASARCRARQAATGRTFHELLERVGGEREVLVAILRSEIALGRVVYLGGSRRYRLNGQLPEDVREALRQLALEDDDRSRPAA